MHASTGVTPGDGATPEDGTTAHGEQPTARAEGYGRSGSSALNQTCMSLGEAVGSSLGGLLLAAGVAAPS